jgi:hypothetical protein
VDSLNSRRESAAREARSSRCDVSEEETEVATSPPSYTFRLSPPRSTSTSSPRRPSSARCGRRRGRPHEELEVIEGVGSTPSPCRAGSAGLEGSVAPLLHHLHRGVRRRTGQEGGAVPLIHHLHREIRRRTGIQRGSSTPQPRRRAPCSFITRTGGCPRPPSVPPGRRRLRS